MLENSERMFDVDSFQEEITKPSEALACYNYFVNNLPKFRQELSEEGLTYNESERIIGKCWLNLASAGERVGWTNKHIINMVKKYRQTGNKEGK